MGVIIIRINSKSFKTTWITILLCILVLFVGCSSDSATQSGENSNESIKEELRIHFIDVGQADSILVQQGSAAMIIDAGNSGDSQTIMDYINQLGIKKLDYVIGTHVHEDHIGSMDTIIKTFQIGKVYSPKQTATTGTFKDYVKEVVAKGLKLTVPAVGETFNLGEATCTVLAPNGTNYKDANDYSIVIKIVYGNTSFLLTGDAEAVSEKEMLMNGLDLQVDVLKVGHHGSTSSTGTGFLEAVNPKYAVLSVGKDNKYNHPAQTTMDRLKNAGVKVFRTDEQGTIVAVSNGKEVTFNQQLGSYNGIISSENSRGNQTIAASPQDSESRVVFWTPAGKSYHYDKGCSALYKSKVIEEGTLSSTPKTEPCDRCVP